jgi:class 3 adenylate cyclase/tetratricopeptide (TPR) repeat protein
VNRCAHCGAVNVAGQHFCGDCGAPLAGGGASALLSPPHTEVHASARISDATTPTDGERRHLTVLFSDLVNSTEIAGHLDPEDWHDIAAEYQRTAAAAVTRFGGHVAKYLGDGVMVYFGWPQAHEDDAERAVRAGLAIVDDVDALNRRLAVEHNLRLSVRVGIQSGSVVMGRGGGGEEADVFGDAPNVASRVQSAAEPNSVMITAAVHGLVSGLFIVEDRGANRLKGIEDPVRLYRAIRPTVVRRHALGGPARALTPFVGREDDMRLLLSRWERARDGQGQLVLVIGEPGIGKSRLVEEFRACIRNDPHVWVQCAGEQFYQNTPFHAVAQILVQGLDRRGEDSPEERVVQLERALERSGLKLSEAVPLIADMLGLPIPEKYPPLVFAPDQRRRRLLANLAAWVLNAARVQPVVMSIEDLHWIDPSTLELTQTLVEQVATTPLMLLYTARPEFHVPWSTRAYHAEITLNRLNDRSTREMVSGVVARAGLPQALIDAVVKRTDGVPLFAEELTRLILEGDHRSIAHEIPATLRDSLTARLDRLGPAKQVAQVAAVIGREFSYELLKAVLPSGEGELDSALKKLLDAELIYARGIAPEATYQFKHALIQDAAYEALLKTRRRELHHRVAQAITGKFAAVAEEHPEVIARHLTEAGESEPAIAAWRKAADAAFERHAFKEAEQAYRQTLILLRNLPESRDRDGRELEVMNRFAPVLQVTRGWAAPDAAEATAHALALAEKSDNLAQLVLQTVGSFAAVISRGDLPTASAITGQLLDLSKREGSKAALGLAYACGVTSCYCQGDLTGAEKQFVAGAPLFKDAGKKFPSALGSGFGFGSHAAWMMGHADAARDRSGQAIASATELNSPFELAYVQWLSAILRVFLREFAAAKTAAATAVALSDQHGFQQYAAGSRIFLGLAEAALGNPARGMPIVRLGLKSLNDSGFGVMMTLFTSSVASAEALDGDVPRALETIEQALQMNPAELSWRPEAIRIRGELRLRLQEDEAAERDFREAVALARQIGASAWELRSAMSLARMLRLRGDSVRARSVLEPPYSSFTEGFDTADLRDADALLDELSNPL